MFWCVSKYLSLSCPEFSCAVEALKAVIKREKSSLMQSVSLAGGWDLLSVPETYLEGVLLLAR